MRDLTGQPMTREEALAMQGARSIADLSEDVPPHAVACRTARVIEIEPDDKGLVGHGGEAAETVKAHRPSR